MKKFIALILIICLILSLAACAEPEVVIEGVKETDADIIEEVLPDESPEPAEAAENTVPSGPRAEALDLIEKAEAYEAELDANLKNSDFTQAEMNNTAYKIYESWDKCLNAIWAILKRELPESDMESLTSEEIQWIQYKNAAVDEVGRDAQGGTIYGSITFSKAAELTKERASLLIEYLR